jgi:hypothetical protein
MFRTSASEIPEIHYSQLQKFLKDTIRGDDFVLHKSEDGMIIFASKVNIEVGYLFVYINVQLLYLISVLPLLPILLIDTKKLFNMETDGTFKACPKLFKKGQLYSIQGLMMDKDENDRTRREAFPLVYGLLPNKSQDTYVSFLPL